MKKVSPFQAAKPAFHRVWRPSAWSSGQTTVGGLGSHGGGLWRPKQKHHLRHFCPRYVPGLVRFFGIAFSTPWVGKFTIPKKCISPGKCRLVRKKALFKKCLFSNQPAFSGTYAFFGGGAFPTRVGNATPKKNA